MCQSVVMELTVYSRDEQYIKVKNVYMCSSMHAHRSKQVHCREELL